MYEIKRYDSVSNTYKYMKTCKTFSNASDEVRRLERVLRGKYKIVEKR